MSANNGVVVPQVVEVSAPGKVILHGEHSVVYGKRAIALSLDLRTHLTMTIGGDVVSLYLPDVETKESWTLRALEDLWGRLGLGGRESEATPLTKEQGSLVEEFLGFQMTHPHKMALLSFFHLYLAILPRPLAMIVRVKSRLPIGSGLGSSASYGVCLSAALLRVSGSLNQCQLPSAGVQTPLPRGHLKEVCRWALASERLMHGTPSGIDNSVCTYGGLLSFKGGEASPLEAPPLRVLLVDTGVPRSTMALVGDVRRRRERHPRVIEPILQSLDALAECGLQVLQRLQHLASTGQDQERDLAYGDLNELVDLNQALLCALGVSHPKLDKLTTIARAHGIHAKLTGAGGGGFALAVLGGPTTQGAVNACMRELKDAGYSVWLTDVGAQGLTFHQNPCHESVGTPGAP